MLKLSFEQIHVCGDYDVKSGVFQFNANERRDKQSQAKLNDAIQPLLVEGVWDETKAARVVSVKSQAAKDIAKRAGYDTVEAMVEAQKTARVEYWREHKPNATFELQHPTKGGLEINGSNIADTLPTDASKVEYLVISGNSRVLGMQLTETTVCNFPISIVAVAEPNDQPLQLLLLKQIRDNLDPSKQQVSKRSRLVSVIEVYTENNYLKPAEIRKLFGFKHSGATQLYIGWGKIGGSFPSLKLPTRLLMDAPADDGPKYVEGGFIDVNKLDRDIGLALSRTPSERNIAKGQNYTNVFPKKYASDDAWKELRDKYDNGEKFKVADVEQAIQLLHESKPDAKNRYEPIPQKVFADVLENCNNDALNALVLALKEGNATVFQQSFTTLNHLITELETVATATT